MMSDRQKVDTQGGQCLTKNLPCKMASQELEVCMGASLQLLVNV